MPLVQVPPHMHPERQWLLFPGGTCQHLWGKIHAAVDRAVIFIALMQFYMYSSWHKCGLSPECSSRDPFFLSSCWMWFSFLSIDLNKSSYLWNNRYFSHIPWLWSRSESLVIFSHMQTQIITTSARIAFSCAHTFTLAPSVAFTSGFPHITLLCVSPACVCVIVALGALTTACVLWSNNSVVAHKAISRPGWMTVYGNTALFLHSQMLHLHKS